MTDNLTIAVPKGRLLSQIQARFTENGYPFHFEKRKLTAQTPDGTVTIFLVKNSDILTYVDHGIAGLGICGDDLLFESAREFYFLHTFSFGSTNMVLAGKPEKEEGLSRPETGFQKEIHVATKFTRFTQHYFHNRGIPVEVIKLNGSVELAPLLGLTPYIVDLVETGNTLRANNLVIFENLAKIYVRLIANRAYYKIHFREIDALVQRITGREER